MEQDINQLRMGLLSASDFKNKHGEEAYYDALGIDRQPQQPPAPQVQPPEEQSFFGGLMDNVTDVATSVVRGAMNAGAELRETVNGVNSVTPEEFDTNFNSFMDKKAEARGAPFTQKEKDMAWLEQRRNYEDMGIDISEVADRPDLNVDTALQNIADAGGPDLTETLAKSDSMLGAATEGITQFMTGFFALGGGRTFVGSMLKGGVVDATMFDAFEGNLSTFIEEEYPHLSNPLTELLKIDPDDPEWTNRAKNALEGGLLGLGAESVLRLIGGAAKFVGYGRKANEEIKTLGAVTDDTAAKLDDAHIDMDEQLKSDIEPEGMKANPDGTFEAPDGAVFRMEDEKLVQIKEAPPEVATPRETPNAPDAPEFDPEGPAPVRSPEPEASTAAPDRVDPPTVTDEQVRLAQDFDARMGKEPNAQDLEGLNVVPARSDAPEIGTPPRPVLDPEPQTTIEVDQPVAPTPEALALADQSAATVIKVKPKVEVVDKQKLLDALDNAAEMGDFELRNIDEGGFFNLGRFDGTVSGAKIIDSLQDVLATSKGFARMGLDKTEGQDTVVRKSLQFLAGSTGTNVNKLIRDLNVAETIGRDTAARIVAGKIAIQSVSREINTFAKRIQKAELDGSISDNMEARLVDLMQTQMELMANVKGLQTAAARATAAGRIVTKDGLESGALDTLSAFGGSKRVRRLAEELAKVTDEKIMARTVTKVMERKGLRVLNEFWINSILSGPTTHALNVTSNTINVLARPAERALGAALNGDVKEVKAALRTYKYMAYYFKDSIQLAAKSGYNMRPILDDSVKVENATQTTSRAISSEYIGGGTAVDVLGKALTIPSRMLGAEDEFFKQLSYRASLQARLSTDAAYMSSDDFLKAGYNSREEWIQGNFDGAFNSKINAEEKWQEAVLLGKVEDSAEVKASFIAQRVGSSKTGNKYAEMALNEAREATFTTKLTKENSMIAYDIQKLANKHPGLRQVFPFIQTPMNIMGQAWDRTPGLNLLRKQYVADLTSGDPTRVAQAKGKFAVGTAIYTTLSLAAWDDKITGGGPTDPKLARLWRDSPNWQPYSFNFGTKEKPYWVSYARMDPWTTAFGIVGDMKEMIQIGSMDDTTSSDMVAMFVAAAGNNIVSKTYLQGISDVVGLLNSKDSPWEVEGFLKNRMASLIPYSGFTNQVGNLTDDYTREVSSYMDKLRKSTGIQRSKLPLQYNWLTGEAKNTPEHFGPLFHITTKGVEEIDTDAALISNEFRKLGFRFEGARRKTGGVELTGEQFQRWNQLIGTIKVGSRTLEQTLAREIGKDKYNKDGQDYGDVAPNESHRVAMLNKRMKKFRDRAFRTLQKEFPVIREQSRAYDKFLRATKRGKDVDRPELDLSQID